MQTGIADRTIEVVRVRILVIKPSSLGDIVHAFPAVTRLVRAFPDAGVAWVVNRGLAPLVRMFPVVNEVIEFPREAWWKAAPARPGLVTFLRQIRRFRADVAVDFQGLLRTGLMGRLSGAPRRIGFRDAREGAHRFYTERIAVPAEIRHAVDRNLALVQAGFGLENEPQEPAAAPPRLPESARARVRRRLSAAGCRSGQPILAVVPDARWPTKQWPPAEFAAALDVAAAAAPEARIFLVGGSAGRPAAEAVLRHCRTARPVNLAGRTNLAEMVALLAESSIVLTNDTGPMHVAAWLGKPVAAVFGPTDPARTGPYGPGHRVFAGECPAAPCRRRRFPRSPEECLRGIDPEVVGTAVAGMLRNAPPRAAVKTVLPPESAPGRRTEPGDRQS